MIARTSASTHLLKAVLSIEHILQSTPDPIPLTQRTRTPLSPSAPRTVRPIKLPERHSEQLSALLETEEPGPEQEIVPESSVGRRAIQSQTASDWTDPGRWFGQAVYGSNPRCRMYPPGRQLEGGPWQPHAAIQVPKAIAGSPGEEGNGNPDASRSSRRNVNDDLRLRSRLRGGFVTTILFLHQNRQPISPSQPILFYLFLPTSHRHSHSVVSRGQTRSRSVSPARYARATAGIMTLDQALSESDVEAFLQKLKAAGEIRLWVLSLKSVLG